MIPLDGSTNSIRGLKFGIDLAKQAEASIIGLNVNKIPFYLKSSVLDTKKAQNKKIIDHAKIISKKSRIAA